MTPYLRCTIGLLLATSAGCGLHATRYRYSYDGEWFATSEEMLAAQAKKQEGWLRAIIPRHRPLVAACTIVLPRLEILRKNAVFRSNEATARDVTVLAESVRSDLVFTSKVVQQRRVCGSTRLLESDGRHLQPTDTETYLYVFSGEEGAVDWYVVEAGHHRRPVPDDRRIVDNEQHLADWLDRLEQRILP